VRQEHRVDVELPDASRDQLGELTAEVEDDDGVRLDAVRSIVGAASGNRSVEGGLEIRLDFRVVGRKDAMPGVGRLTVDGLAAVAGNGRSSPTLFREVRQFKV